MAGKTGRGISEVEEIESMKQFSAVEQLLRLIPAKVISARAVQCGSYARALFHWEQYYREEQHKANIAGESFVQDEMLQHLQHIYAQIDEPDSIEGISAHLLVLNPEQQIMEHRKAGRWTAAQTWYELALAEKPNDPETQINLLTCLKESGQYGKKCILENGKNCLTSRCRCDFKLCRRVSRVEIRFVQYLTVRCRSSVVHWEMGSTGTNSRQTVWTVCCLFIGFQRWHRQSVDCTEASSGP